MRSFLIGHIAYIIFAVLGLIGCSLPPSPEPPIVTPENELMPSPSLPPPTETATPLPPSEFVQVDGIKVETSRGHIQFLVQITLPNECHTLGPINQSRRGRNIMVTIGRVIGESANCPPQTRQIEQIVDIDSTNLEVGFYAYNVNDLAGSFALDQTLVDEMNFYIETEGAAQATLAYIATSTVAAHETQEARVASGVAEIHGTLWHDVCLSQLSSVSSNSADDVLPSGCRFTENSLVIGNGQQDEAEEGIPFITIQLGEGACPSTETVAETLTTASGTFDFFDLPPNTYCLSVNNRGPNETLLADGVWTTAEPSNIYSETITLQPRQIIEGISLGWDYARLPRADIASGCINKGFLVYHLNYPPDTVLTPGQTVEKGWRVQNIGTCTWEPDYGIVRTATDGSFDPDDIIPLDQIILPNEEGSIFVAVNLPHRSGRYPWLWRLVDADQTPFGIGLANDDPLRFDFVIPGAPATATPVTEQTDGSTIELEATDQP